MFKPTAGELLEGVIDGLRQSVMPALPPGTAQRQLRAALHVLGRLQRSWDLLPDYLEADTEDVRATLHAVLAAQAFPRDDGRPTVASRLEALRADESAVIRGVNAPALAAQCSTHEQLQALLAETDSWLRAPERNSELACIEQASMLDKLYARMAERQLRAWGTQEAET